MSEQPIRLPTPCSVLQTFLIIPFASHNLSLEPSDNLSNRLPLNNTFLLIISADTIVVITEIRALHVTQELLIVGNDNELKVGLLHSGGNDAVERFGERLNVVDVQVSGWFV